MIQIEWFIRLLFVLSAKYYEQNFFFSGLDPAIVKNEAQYYGIMQIGRYAFFFLFWHITVMIRN